MIKLEITIDIGQTYRGCPYWSSDAYSGRCFTFYAEWGIFYILIKDPWHPSWEIRITGKLCCSLYHRCPTRTLEIQKAHTPLCTPRHRQVEEVTQSSSKALKALTSPLLMVLILLPCHTVSCFRPEPRHISY